MHDTISVCAMPPATLHSRQGLAPPLLPHQSHRVRVKEPGFFGMGSFALSDEHSLMAVPVMHERDDASGDQFDALLNGPRAMLKQSLGDLSDLRVAPLILPDPGQLREGIEVTRLSERHPPLSGVARFIKTTAGRKGAGMVGVDACASGLKRDGALKGHDTGNKMASIEEISALVVSRVIRPCVHKSR